MSETKVKKKRGRPSTKVKLKHNPATAKSDFLKQYKDVTDIGIYGVDDFTKEIIEHLWLNPEITFYVTDENSSRLTNMNRHFGQRSFSMYRFNVMNTSGFIEHPPVEVILVSKDMYEAVKKRPNPYHVKLILLEDI
jgi:hypothetical protein